MNNQELFYNEWISLRKISSVKQGIRGYVYSHETRCNGRIVSILPYRRILTKSDKVKRQYLLKFELTPCWSTKKSIYSTITGGKESEYPKLDATRELLEETGYAMKPSDFISLGTSYASKSSDTIYDLFSIDLTNILQGEILGDGSVLEKKAKAIWVESQQILDCLDPQASVIFLRLQKHLGYLRML